jgi:PAS domain S-box-containing protein
LGSPAYMAPEQAAGRQDLIGPSTDIYGLSAILYEILCGQPPFHGSTVLEVLKGEQEDDPASPCTIAPGVPEVLERICLQGLAKPQSQRHPSAESLALAVQRWVSDLAERRQAEEERERFFALSLDLLAIIDRDGRFRQTSPAWNRVLAYDRTQLVGRSFADVVRDEHHAVSMRCLKEVCDKGTPGSFEAKAKHSDGSYRWISWNVTPIAKEQCVYVVGRDITELKRSQQLFEGVLQSAPDVMVIINSTGRIVMVNRQTEHVFGYQRDEMLGEPIEMLIPERYGSRHPANVDGFFASSSVWPMGAGLQLSGRRKGGQEFPVDIALSPIMTEDGKLVAASVRNVSYRE